MSGAAEFHPLAIDEISAAYDYLFAHADRDTAEDFRQRVDEKIDYCLQNPSVYRIRRYQVRRANLERFKEHYLAYMLWNGRFVVIALGHAKRRHFTGIAGLRNSGHRMAIRKKLIAECVLQAWRIPCLIRGWTC